MNNLKLSLLKKWELDSELSFVHGSVLLPVVVTDSNGTHIFQPDGTEIFIPK